MSRCLSCPRTPPRHLTPPGRSRGVDREWSMPGDHQLGVHGPLHWNIVGLVNGKCVATHSP